MGNQGKRVFVTGGSEGYGYGMAKRLKADGAEVFISGRDRAKLDRAAAELGVEAIHADAGSAADWDRAFAHLDNRLDVLVNNAGGGVRIAPLAEQTDADIERSIRTNLLGVLYGCRRAAQAMIPRKAGLIINVSSVCAHYGWPGFTPYSAAKAGLDMMSRTLYTELRPHNIRVTVLTPSWGDTHFSEAAKTDAASAELRAKMMSPEQMGELVSFLCGYPDHLVFPEVMVQPLVQEIVPF